MFALLSLALVVSGAAEKPRLVVLDLQASKNLDASLAGPLTDAVTAEVQRRGFFDVLSSRDIQTMLGVERQKQLLGCEQNACYAELIGGLGARFVLNGTLARLGDAYQLTLTGLDSERAQPLGRATRIASSLQALRAQLPSAVAEATGIPQPAPPSKALPITLLAGGGAAAVFGLVWGSVHLAQEFQLGSVLDAAGDTAGILSTRAAYQIELSRLATQRWVALGTLSAGAIALVVGAILFADDTPPRVALVPTGSGVALTGAF